MADLETGIVESPSCSERQTPGIARKHDNVWCEPLQTNVCGAAGHAVNDITPQESRGFETYNLRTLSQEGCSLPKIEIYAENLPQMHGHIGACACFLSRRAVVKSPFFRGIHSNQV